MELKFPRMIYYYASNSDVSVQTMLRCESVHDPTVHFAILVSAQTYDELIQIGEFISDMREHNDRIAASIDGCQFSLRVFCQCLLISDSCLKDCKCPSCSQKFGRQMLTKTKSFCVAFPSGQTEHEGHDGANVNFAPMSNVRRETSFFQLQIGGEMLEEVRD